MDVNFDKYLDYELDNYYDNHDYDDYEEINDEEDEVR